MATKYLQLKDAGDAAPWGVLRFNDKTGVIERYNDGEWFKYPFGADVVVGGEPGAQEISKKQAAQLIANGKLVVLSKQTQERFTGKE